VGNVRRGGESGPSSNLMKSDEKELKKNSLAERGDGGRTGAPPEKEIPKLREWPTRERKKTWRKALSKGGEVLHLRRVALFSKTKPAFPSGIDQKVERGNIRKMSRRGSKEKGGRGGNSGKIVQLRKPGDPGRRNWKKLEKGKIGARIPK